MRHVLACSVVMTIAFASACSKHDDCASLATCPVGDAGTSGSDAEAGGEIVYPPVPPPAGCSPVADPASPGAAPCIDETYALFVDATTGSDTGSGLGTKALPYRTIAFAADRHRLAGRPRIYVSEATQNGNVDLPPGVSLVGGFTRTDWSHPEGQTTSIVGEVGGPPTLFFRESPSDITLSDLTVSAPARLVSGESSIGLFIAAARATLYRLNVHAEAAVNGTTAVTLPSNRRKEVGTGDSATGATPGQQTSCACAVSGTTTGGAGGEINQNGATGASDPAGTFGSTGAGGAGNSGTCVPGQKGRDGAGGKGGEAGLLNVVDAMGWHPASGADGEVGGPGGGGGGGGGSSNLGTGGGGGGCGGCGGSGGKGGAAGGSSFGILGYNSSITIVASTIRGSNAGTGEIGGSGEGGEAGAAPGAGCALGGQGGAGGGGGGGGGGAPGMSAAVAHHGGSVVRDDASELSFGVAATLALGGSAGQAINNGQKGDNGSSSSPALAAAQILVLP